MINLNNNKIKKMKGIIFILIMGIISSNIYYNINTTKIISENNIKIESIESYNKFIKNDVKIYKKLYTESDKNNKELQVKYVSTDNELKNLKSEIVMAKNIEKRLSRGCYTEKDLRTNFAITTDELNKWIKERASKNSPFIGRADIFIEASKETGLDPKYLVSHAALESTWGKSSIAREKNNYFGINAQNADPNKAYNLGSDLRTGIINGSKWIANNYTNDGQPSLNSMIYGKKTYCEHDDGTPSQQWIDQIMNIIE